MCFKHGNHAILLLLAISSQRKFRVCNLQCDIQYDDTWSFGNNALRGKSIFFRRNTITRIIKFPGAGLYVSNCNKTQHRFDDLLILRDFLLLSACVRLNQRPKNFLSAVDLCNICEQCCRRFSFYIRHILQKAPI